MPATSRPARSRATPRHDVTATRPTTRHETRSATRPVNTPRSSPQPVAERSYSARASLTVVVEVTGSPAARSAAETDRTTVASSVPSQTCRCEPGGTSPPTRSWASRSASAPWSVTAGRASTRSTAREATGRPPSPTRVKSSPVASAGGRPASTTGIGSGTSAQRESTRLPVLSKSTTRSLPSPDTSWVPSAAGVSTGSQLSAPPIASGAPSELEVGEAEPPADVLGERVGAPQPQPGQPASAGTEHPCADRDPSARRLGHLAEVAVERLAVGRGDGDAHLERRRGDRQVTPRDAGRRGRCRRGRFVSGAQVGELPGEACR